MFANGELVLTLVEPAIIPFKKLQNGTVQMVLGNFNLGQQYLT
jgi:hypothetical protein